MIKAGAISKVIIIGSIVLLLIAFRETFPILFKAWKTDEYSHGILIPVLSLLLAWHLLVRAPPLPVPSWWGPVTIVIAAIFLMVGNIVAFPTAQEYGFIISLLGLSLTFLGIRATILLVPAFTYLVFAVPLPHLTYATLSQDFQLLSSSLGVGMLDLFAIPVYQEGNIIDLGSTKLQVAEACNGLRYLFPLMSFGYLAAYLLRDRSWKRLIIFFSTIPIAIGINALRIALIGVTVDLWGSSMAEGFIHDLEGWAVFLICVGILMIEVWALSRIGTHGHFRFEYLGLAYGNLTAAPVRLSLSGTTTFFMCLMMAGLFGSRMVDLHAETAVSYPSFASFPLDLSPWHGKPENLDPDILQSLQLSDYWLANYKNSETDKLVNLYIAYYDSQHIGSSTHSPANCIPGGGWQIISNAVETVPDGQGKTLALSRLLIRKGELEQLVYYWFDERGRNLTETYAAKWYMLVDSITLHRTDGALIRLTTPVARNESESDAERRLQSFVIAIYPDIQRFVPGKALQ